MSDGDRCANTRASIRAQLARPSQLVLASAVGRLASLAALSVLARSLPSRDFAIVALALSTAAPISLLASRGYPIAATRRAAELTHQGQPLGPLQTVVDSWTRRVIFLFILLALLVVASSLLFVDTPSAKLLTAGLGGLCLAAIAVRTSIDVAFLNGVHMAHAAGVVLAGRNLVWLVVVVAVAASGQAGSVPILVGTCLTDVGTSIALRRLRRRGDLYGSPRAAGEALKLRRFAGIAYLDSILVSFALWGSQAAIGARSTLSEFAVFTVAQRWAQVALFVPAAVAPMVLPAMTRATLSADRTAMRRVLIKSGLLVISTSVIPAIGIVGLAPKIMSIAGNEYAPHAVVLRVLAIGAIAVSLNTILSQWLVATSQLKLWLASDVALASVLIAASIAAGDSLTARTSAAIFGSAYVVSCMIAGGGWALAARRPSVARAKPNV